jgi:WD40 repeat protein
MTQLYAGSEKWQQQAALALPNGRFVTWHDGLQLWSYYGEKIGDEVEVGTIGAILIGYDQLLTWNALGAFQLRAMDLKKIGDPILAHTSWPTGVIVLRDNRLLSMSNDQTLRLWTPAGKLAGAPMRGHQADVIGATELDDGRLLSWSRDRTMRVWSAEGLSLRRHLFWYGVPTELPGTLLFRTDVLERRANSPSPYRHVQCQVD